MYTLHKKPEQPKTESAAKKHPDFNETEMKAIRAGLNDRIALFGGRINALSMKMARTTPAFGRDDRKELDKLQERQEYCTALRDKLNDFLGNDGIADY